MRAATRFMLVAGLAVSAPANAAYFYNAVGEIIASDYDFRETNTSSMGEPPQAMVTSTGLGSLGSTGRSEVAPGLIRTWTTGTYSTLSPPPEGADPAGDGFVQARGLGFVRDTLVVDAAAATGFLQVALAYNNDGYFETDYLGFKPGIITSLYDIYYDFAAGTPGGETRFVDYNHRVVAVSISSGTGFVIDDRLTTYQTGDFASGQVFLVPFTSGEDLSILLTGDCTGTVQVTDIGSGRAGCGNNQAFGWGGILGAVDDKGNPITLRSVTSASGDDYLGNLSGLKFEPVFAVPEPAIWAQFIIGFGLAGSFARQRRAIAA